ncbi:type II secretion system protein [Fibrobacter sp. UWB3]|uniref:type II secretion system protein n=1 Tax=Fibrobacter sp. UWB3 TaxID=1964357 RepID=UPI000B525FB9|nr:type II secretion system protein [Fibrobacter sp. UWB3]OWV21377.1 hypothetical protein B7991_05185 [Fibrobacter sp. UWB3]
MHFRHTERSEVSGVSCVALAANSRLGFTLPEVCVALAIFLVGTTALLGGWNFFNREVADERMRLEKFYDVLGTMESLIASRPNCADSLTGERSPDSLVVSVRLTRVPGSPHLAWAVVASEHYSLKRLVRCR